MATRRKGSRITKEHPAAKLIAGLKFIEAAQRKIGTHEQQFCIARGGMLVASDGLLTLATPIDEDLNTCPHTMQLLAALTKCEGPELQIAQLSPTALSVRSGSFTGIVQCIDNANIPPPDPQCAVIDDRIKTAIDNVMCLTVENAPQAPYASVLLQAGSCVATNGFALVEYWHGIDLPPNLMIPRQFCSAVAKCKKKLTGFGFSQSSVTFYCDDGSVLKTQLYKGTYPNYQLLLNVPIDAKPLPASFFSAVRAVEEFNERGTVYFRKGAVASSERENEASTYVIEGLTEDMAFNSKFLTLLELCIKSADFRPHEKKMYFYGDNARGVIMGMDVSTAPAVSTHDTRPKTGFDDMDDNIPF